jgi:hypothetical protein
MEGNGREEGGGRIGEERDRERKIEEGPDHPKISWG